MSDEIKRATNSARNVIGIGILVSIAAIVLFTSTCFRFIVDFEKTGTIGDTIGGITAPIINLIGAILVYYAFRAQLEANKIISDQISDDKRYRQIENETQNLNKLYDYVKESISNFKFRCLNGYVPIYTDDEAGNKVLADNEFEKQDLVEQQGATAFATFFNQIRCNYHGEEENLNSDPCVSDVYSILLMINLLLKKLNSSKNPNEEIVRTLLEHQFTYRVIASIRNERSEDLKIEFCENCKRNHGIPNNILQLIEEIKKQFT